MRFMKVGDELVVSFTRVELGLIAGSIGEALEALDDWEYSIRLGVQPHEARELLMEINEVLESTSEPQT